MDLRGSSCGMALLLFLSVFSWTTMSWRLWPESPQMIVIYFLTTMGPSNQITSARTAFCDSSDIRPVGLGGRAGGSLLPTEWFFLPTTPAIQKLGLTTKGQRSRDILA